MDTQTLRTAIKQVLNQYARYVPSHGKIRLETVFDTEQDRYALMQTGWSQKHRIRGNLIYITLQDDNVIIEYDGTEQGISDDLLACGIPSEKIIFAFLVEEPLALVG
ncbi:MAG: XisI protein [Synechococcales cyanobacterium CRU_2_2]|nr:XisI protein [Synechococcales cyanobacterium CRU_2_2]